MDCSHKEDGLTHFKLETCREIIFNIGDHTFLKGASAMFFCTYAYIFGNGMVLVYIVMLGTAGVLDHEFPGNYATTTMKTFLMVTEAISIMENIGELGWPVPLKLLEFLKVHSDKKEPKKKD